MERELFTKLERWMNKKNRKPLTYKERARSEKPGL